MGRSLLAVVGGIVVGGSVVFLVELVGVRLYPPPPGFDPHDPAAMKRLAGSVPPGAFAMVLLAWLCGSVAGGWLAARIARQARLALSLSVGAVQMVAGLATLLSFTHPTWVWVVGMLVFLPGAWLGHALAGRPPA